MPKTTPEQNKALVLKAFDTFFNKRDYMAVERFWSPNYIQHSAHIEPGREGLFNLIKSLPNHSKVRSRFDCRRWRLRDRTWALFRIRSTSELDRG
jgi:predicted SnoaL-like aldol condensation-catalyzing enzyme